MPAQPVRKAVFPVAGFGTRFFADDQSIAQRNAAHRR